MYRKITGIKLSDYFSDLNMIFFERAFPEFSKMNEIHSGNL